jgi:sigma-B regulation protein RsbU (phosphoserine phosphatase)
VEWNARCVTADGTIFAVGRDVTEERNYEEELRAREQRERAILENTPAVVYVKDTAGNYLYVNQRYTDLFALEQSDVVGKTDYEIFPKVLADKFRHVDRQVIESRRKSTSKEMAPHQDGLHTYVSVKFPLFDAKGAVSAIAGISTDITDDLRNQEFQEQLKLATAFQRKLYPLSAPSLAGLDLFGSAIPAAQLCGDYYDFIITGAGRVVIAVGDVSGHSVGSALAMVEVRSILRGLLHYGSNARLADVIWKLNELLVEDLPEGCFVTLFLAEIDVVRRRLQYAGAGHQGVLIRANGEIELLNATASVVGLLESTAVRDVAPIVINERDVLFVCTDGVTEAMNHQHELFRLDRAAECVATHRRLAAEEIIQRLFSRVIEFTEGRGNTDDMTAVVAALLEISP